MRAGRDTRTGGVLEKMVIPALTKGGYLARKGIYIGTRLGGGREIVDVIASDHSGRSFLVSLKWQQTSGTAEQKVPFEIMCLADAVRSSAGRYDRAYLVLGGSGWKLRKFFVKRGFEPFMRDVDDVAVLEFEDFIARANKGLL